MSYIVIKSGNKVEMIGEEDFSADKDEKYLHKIIEEHPEIVLKEITERDVVTLGSHLKLPSGGELDLLLIDSGGNLILVELKKGKGHREAIAQLLDYASDLQQMSENDLFNSVNVRFQSIEEVYKHFYESDEEFPYDDFRRNFLESLTDPNKIQLLLVSYTIGDDTLRLAEWLRKFGINIFCVEFEYFKSEDKEIFVPKLHGGAEETKRVERKKLTEAQEKYFRFFSDVLSSFKERKPGVTERRATTDSWQHIPAGFSDIHFQWEFLKREPNKILEVALHFESNDEKFNQMLFEYFKSKENELKEKLGVDDLKFGNVGSKWRKIYVEKFVGTLDKALESDEIKNWAVEMMIRFYETFKESGELDKATQEVRERTRRPQWS